MLRVLTLSTLFPTRARPSFGIFVERQVLGLAALPGVEVQIVSPVGLPSWPLSLHPHFAERRALPLQEDWKGIPMHRPRFPVVPFMGQGSKAARMAKALLPVLTHLRSRFPFDVIDAEFFWPDGPAAMALSHALGVPFSVKARGSDINHWQHEPDIASQLVATGAAAGGLLAVSAALKREMADIGLPEDKIAVHYTGVDLDRFKPIDRSEAKAGMQISGSLILCVGALIARKGQRLALEALQAVPNATLIFVGDGPDRGALEEYARSLGLEARVRFLGVRPHEEVARLLGAADVLLHPASSEGLANVWVEAMACGTPVVAGLIGGADEAIADEAGKIVALEPAALAAALRDLIDTPPDPSRVRQSAQRFSWEKNSQELFKHLSHIVKSGTVPVRPR